MSTCTKNICDMPYEIWYRIFMLVYPDDVLSLRSVCRTLHKYASSESLWKALLDNDMETWTVVSHSHNPMVGSSRPAMEIYRICRPRRSELTLPPSALRNMSLLTQFFGGLKSIMGGWAQSDIPRVAIFGPGIESRRTSSIVSQLLGMPIGETIPTATKLIEFLRPPPGAEGFGGGLVELIPTGQRFHMLTLYTQVKDARERQPDDHDRLIRSPFFAETSDGEKSPKAKIKELFSTLSGLIYVVDSTNPTGKVPPSADKELNLLSHLSSPSAPLLILAAFGPEAGPNCKTVSPASCVKQLGLCTIARPWQVSAIQVGKGSEQLVVPVNWLGASASNIK